MLNLKFKLRTRLPEGTQITGDWGVRPIRTIYNNKISFGTLYWSEKPDDGRLHNSWSMKSLKVVRMGYEDKMEDEEAGRDSDNQGYY